MIRHLLYDCCALRDNTFPWGGHPDRPAAGSAEWKLNIEKICSYAHVFNGRKVVVLRVGDIVHTPDEVKPFFATLGDDVEFIERPNCPFPGLREADGFAEHLGMLKPSGLEPELVFFAHTKGVARGGEERIAIRWWRDTMYEKCLEYPELIDSLMEKYAAVGCFRMGGAPAGCPRSMWHFSGTFYWLNLQRVFAVEGWDDLPHTPYAAEGFPGIIFKHNESYCLYEDNPRFNLYEVIARYQCKNCGYEFDARKGIRGNPLKICSECHKRQGYLIGEGSGSCMPPPTR